MSIIFCEIGLTKDAIKNGMNLIRDRINPKLLHKENVH